MSINRDHYEGTKYDTTKGLAAGPFGAPIRYDGAAGEKEVKNGWWERPIDIFRMDHSFVCVPNPVLPYL